MPVQVLRHGSQRLHRQQCAQQVIHRVISLGFQIVIQFCGGLAVCAAQFIRIGGKKAAALEKRAPAVRQQQLGAGHNGVDEKACQVFCIHKGIPPVTKGGKVGGKLRFVQADGIFIAGGQGGRLPVSKKVCHHAGTHHNKVGLNMLRHHGFCPAKAVAAHSIVAGQAPEIQLRAPIHHGKHGSYIPHRPGKGIVHQHNFIIMQQHIQAGLQNSVPVGPHIKACVFTLQHSVAAALRPLAGFRLQGAVIDKEHLPHCGHLLYSKAAGCISLPVGVIIEIDNQPFFHSGWLNPHSSRHGGPTPCA